MKSIHLLFICILLAINPAGAQAPDCYKMPFHPADHIRNPSLEQILTRCEWSVGTSLFNFYPNEMDSLIPFWRSAIKGMSFNYFAVCNNFSLPFDPSGLAVNNVVAVTFLPRVPRPIPDGKGVIGLVNVRTIYGTPRDDSLTRKSYISTNLKRPLTSESLYRLDFALGFGIRDTILMDPPRGIRWQYLISGSPVKFTLWGLSDSTKIPFTPPAAPGLLGCLTTHFKEWIPLGSVVVSGDRGTWQRGVIDFVAPTTIQSIALGPACDQSDVPFTPRGPGEETDINGIRLQDYYFIDDLKFFEAAAPKPRLSQIGGGSCEGQSTTLRLESNNFYNGSAFQWYRNNTPIPETEVALTVSNSIYGPGWYKLWVRNDSVCMMTDSVYLEWSPVISDPFAGHPDTTLCVGDVLELKVSSGPGAVYRWNTGSLDSSITVAKQGTYTVRISNSCNALNATKTVMYKDCPPAVFVPTAFTPNGDGLNDVFRVSASGRIKSFSLSIFNRFGQRIFYSNDPAKGWDGTVKNKKQSSGIYTWLLQYTDASDVSVLKKGTVMLIRQ